MRITKTVATTTKVTIWCDRLPGFGVRVSPSGSRSYVIRYRTAAGTERLLTIGKVEVLHPDEAREMARDKFKEVAQGMDPKADRDKLRDAPSVVDLAGRFLAEHANKKRASTATNYELAFRLHINPRMGKQKVRDVSDEDVEKMHREMGETPIAANRAVAALSKAFTLAERWKWRDRGTNPCEFVEDYPEEARQRILDAEEITRLWDVLDRWDASIPIAPLVKLLLLTGCRTGEWRLALWSWVDLDAGTLSLPDRASKTGQRVVSLAAEVVQILSALPRSSVYVLPGETGGPMSGHQKVWRAIRKTAGLEDVRIHDLRHTFGSWAHRNGLGLKAVADLLGHKQLSTSERYITGIGSEAHRNATIVAGAIVGMGNRNGPNPKKGAVAS
jgi:integrase